MRRILLLFTAAAMMAVMVAMSAGPASASHLRNHFFDFDGFRGPNFVDFDDGRRGPNFGDQELDSGEIETETDISIEGSNNNQCVGALQFGQTGNLANQQGTSEFGDGDGVFGFHGFFFGDGDNELTGPETEFGPENATECEQAVQQAAAASSS